MENIGFWEVVVGGVISALLWSWFRRQRGRREQPQAAADPVATHAFPPEFMSWDIAQQIAYLEEHDLLAAEESSPEGVAMWVIEDIDMGAFDALVSGGRPELAQRFADVFSQASQDPARKELDAWVGEHLAARGLRYDGLTASQAAALDQWAHAVTAPEAFGPELGARGGAMVSQLMLEHWRATLEDCASLLDRLRYGARPDGSQTPPDANGYRPGSARYSPSETKELLRLFPSSAAVQMPDHSSEWHDLQVVLARAVAGGRGLYATNED